MELARKLSAWDAAAIVVGTVIGGGIFLVPALIAKEVQSAPGILLLWVARSAELFRRTGIRGVGGDVSIQRRPIHFSS